MLGSNWEKGSLVYGGGNLGSIENVSIVVFLEDSQVLGIIPKALANENITGKIVGDELKVLTMSERIATILEHFDAFISLPISLDSKRYFRFSPTPNWTLNVNDFYNNLLSFFIMSWNKSL